MRLKRLTIKGFKSFADDTVINFNENLIGIVGPNGSGKSNVVDSIRWVLGEQKTSELRLESMSDVLFNGTKARKEGKVAKVTLSFDNTKNVLPTEYNEVSISRLLYRNGNSEYQLNGVPCRKKDITNLFMDSGIGSNSYAIISLNMVEDILHDNGGSRRQMIEQAAGIAKYKLRKKETLRKLKNTTEDLDRVQDLLFEIEKNMSSFERQAKRTERFNKYKEEYKELSIKISHIEVKEFSLKYKELKEKLEKEKDLRLKISTELTQDDATLQQLKTDILQYEKSLSEDQQAFNKLIEELGKIENNKNLALQRLQNGKDRVEEIKNSAQQLSDSVGTAKASFEEAKENSAKIKLALEKEEESYKEFDKQFQAQSDSYNDLRQREKEIKSAINAKQLLKETLGREIEALLTKQSMLTTDVEGISEKVSYLSGSGKDDHLNLANQQGVIDKYLSTISAAEIKTRELEESIQKSNDDLGAKVADRNKKQVELSSLQQRIKFLKNIIENNEGLPESVKFLLKSSGSKHQVFSDVIEINDEKYTKIIELYLEPYFHHLLVESRSEAIKLYEQVRGAQKGKVNIVITDEINTTATPQPSADLIPLSSLIKTEKEYRPFVQTITKDVFISTQSYKNIDKSSLKEGYTVLFTDEYLVLSQGKLYGGSNTLFEGVQLGRKKILEKLEDQVGDLEKSLGAFESEISKLKEETAQQRMSLTTERSALSEVRSMIDIEKSKLYQIESKIQNQTDNISDLEKQKISKQTELTEVIESLESKNVRYVELDTQKLDELSDQELTQKIEGAHKAYIAAGVDRDKAQAKLFEVRSSYNLAAKDVEFYQNNIGDILGRLEALTNEEQSQLSIIKESEVTLAETKGSLEEQYTLKAKLQEKLSTYEDTYYKEKGKIFELEKKITEFRNKLYNKDQLITSLNEKYTNVGFEIKAIHERNSIEFGIEIKETEFPEEYEGEDLNLLKTKKAKIQDRIRSYGEINPMAITAYNEIKERHDAISKERDDILQAKKSLEETIVEIEKAASERFNAALNEIRKNFKEVFQALFSKDDDCNIVLLDNDDPLEAKIEIVAKPKGKRPKSISLLSGGEKTLTAASFLFALYLLKPAPFCIFDEVDAPLDDVNVLKFNKIIRKFSEDSQFIIITHNKLTMSEVDILYGVYLKELGVSGVSAVDFRTYDQTEMVVANN